MVENLELGHFGSKLLSELKPRELLRYNALLTKLAIELDKRDQTLVFENQQTLEPLFRIHQLCKKGKIKSKRRAKEVEDLIITLRTRFAKTDNRATRITGDVGTSGHGEGRFFREQRRLEVTNEAGAHGGKGGGVRGSTDRGTTQTHGFKYVGVSRLLIECEHHQAKASEYVTKYADLVETIEGILGEQGIGGAGFDYKTLSNGKKFFFQQDFITAVWGIMHSNLEIKYGTNKFGLLLESLDTKEWDCDNSSFLVFDVAQKLGIPAKFAIIDNHVLILTDDFIFETTDGRYYGAGRRYFNYLRQTHFTTSDSREIDALSYEIVGNTMRAQGNLEKANELLQKAITLKPNFTIAYEVLGAIYQEQGNYEKAIECFQKAIELKPDHAPAHHDLGVVYSRQGNLEKAIECYAKAASLRPDPLAYYDMGGAYNDLGDLEKAIESYKAAIGLNPRDPDVNYDLGLAYQKQGNLEKAKECFERALALKPDFEEAREAMRSFK